MLPQVSFQLQLYLWELIGNKVTGKDCRQGVRDDPWCAYLWDKQKKIWTANSKEVYLLALKDRDPFLIEIR